MQPPPLPPPEAAPPLDGGSRSPMLAYITAAGALVAALSIPMVQRHEHTVFVGYHDPIRIVTACTGHTRTAVLGRRYTQAECTQLLAADLLAANAVVNGCITHPLKPHERAAFNSFAFNVGPGKAGVKDGLCVLKDGRPTGIRTLANRGDMAGACAQLSLWTGMGGRDCRLKENRCGGIPKRRAEERAMCEGKYPGGPNDPATAPVGGLV